MKIGFIGCGKMGSALIRGMLKSGFAAEDIVVTDTASDLARTFSSQCGVTAVPDIGELVFAADAVFLCVKPADALKAITSASLAGKLLISIVAGLPLKSLEAGAQGARVVRTMPNTPALVGRGATAYATGAGVTPADRDLVERVFSGIGLVLQVKEDLLDAVTGLSGSGPAYIYMVIEALADGGVRMGLPRTTALQLAAQTVAGAAEMVLQTGVHPGELKDQVTSPGGTTIAGLSLLEERATRSAFIDAVRAATERSRELGKA